MIQLLEIAIQFFQELDWPFLKNEEESTLQTSFRGEKGEWSCYIFASDEQQRLVFYSICPVHATEDKLMAVAEFITRVNHGLIIGNFELDFQSGEIRLKTSIDVRGDRLSVTLVKRIVMNNLATMDIYLPGILKVIYGDASPAQIVAEIETKVK
jgi:hypothetical protein